MSQVQAGTSAFFCPWFKPPLEFPVFGIFWSGLISILPTQRLLFHPVTRSWKDSKALEGFSSSEAVGWPEIKIRLLWYLGFAIWRLNGVGIIFSRNSEGLCYRVKWLRLGTKSRNTLLWPSLLKLYVGTEGVWETWVNPLRAKSGLQELQQMLCNCFSGDCSRMVGRKFREIISNRSIWILQRLPTL